MKAKAAKTVSVFGYMDFRTYLRAKLEELRVTKPQFSYRFFNRLAGISSSGFLKLILDGKRNLGGDGIRKIIKGLDLADDEAIYFEKLVLFNQAPSHEEKNEHLKELLKNKKFLKARPLTTAQYNLFSQWYHVALLELIRLDTNEKKDIAWVQKRMRPQVSMTELRAAVKALGDLGLLVVRSNGVLERKESMLSTPDEVQSVAAANFHCQMSQLAAQNVLKSKPMDREFSALTVAVSEENFLEAKKEIQRFRKKLHSLLEQDNKETRSILAHVNLQLFMLSSEDKR